MSSLPQSHIVDLDLKPADDTDTKPTPAPPPHVQDVIEVEVELTPPPPPPPLPCSDDVASEISEVGNVCTDIVVYIDDKKEEVEEEGKRVSSVSECSVEVLDLESGIPETGPCLDGVKRDCRICHLSMDITNQDTSGSSSIELGCCCKEDLAAAHMQCAQAWFKIKGNKTCEICGSIAQNVSGVPETDATEQWDAIIDGAPLPRTSIPLSEARNFWQGHRFLNFLLACMVFAFVISWLFHFNVPS